MSPRSMSSYIINTVPSLVDAARTAYYWVGGTPLSSTGTWCAVLSVTLLLRDRSATCLPFSVGTNVRVIRR